MDRVARAPTDSLREIIRATSFPTLEYWSPELAGAYADVLGIPATWPWGRLWTPDPIPETGAEIRWERQKFLTVDCPLHLTPGGEPLGPHRHRFPIDVRLLRAGAETILRKYAGYHFEIIQSVKPEALHRSWPEPGDITTWQVRAWKAGSWMFAQWSDRVCSVHDFGGPDYVAPETADDWGPWSREATKAVKLVQRFAGHPGGRRRLRDNPTHSWRHFADQAMDMQAHEPLLSLDSIVERLGLQDEEGQDKTRTMRRWIKQRQAEKSS